MTALVVAAACDDVSRPLAVPSTDGLSRALIAAAKVTGTIAGVSGATSFVIDGSPATVTVTVTNAGTSALKNVSLSARITQGGTSREAGSGPVTCPNSAPGVLPKGATCPVQLEVTASNSSTGSGTLVAGDAALETSLLQAGGKRPTVLDSRSDVIGLTGGSDPGGNPSISNLVLSGSEMILEGTGVNYTITIDNPGPQLTGVFVQAELVQGAATRAAGGVVATCPNMDGVLPPGTCTFTWHASASNLNGGSGTLTAGSADLIISLGQNTTIFDSRTFTVTLVSNEPTEPYIVSVDPTSTTFVIGGTAVSTSILLRNPTQATYTNVVLHATIRQGTAFRFAGDNNHLQCGGRRGELVPGDCQESLSLQASNSSSGSGTLQAGDAVLEIEMTTSGTRLDLVTVPITLVIQ